MKRASNLAAACNNGVLKVFYNYGYLVGKHPIPFMAGCIIICGVLACGLAFIDPMTDMETLYTPMNSDAERDRDIVNANFPDLTGSNYDEFSLRREPPLTMVIVRSRNHDNILKNKYLQDIQGLVEQIKNINMTSKAVAYTYYDVCGRRQNSCVVGGDFLFSPLFRAQYDAFNMTYPVSQYLPNKDLSLNIGRPNVTGPEQTLLGAGALMITFPLRMDNDTYFDRALDWEKAFIDFMKDFKNTLDLDIAFSSSKSLNIELDKSTGGDVIFFMMTFTLMITYASLVSAGGDMVSTRAVLSSAGVLATCFGIVGSFGLVSLIGVQYVNMVGVMPFLLLGIGVDDMFLLMSSWSETTDHPELTVPERIGAVFKKAGIGITITSVTNFLSFVIGATSVFRSVRNFCVYTGAGVVMAYLANVSFFGGALSLHGRRVYSGRHTVTCRRVKSRAELQQEGRGFWYRVLCGGSKPEKSMEDQSACERGPSYALPKFILWNPVRVIVIFAFIANLGVAIWGITTLKEGLNLQELVLKTSYAYDFQEWNKADFGAKLPISFVTTHDVDYKDSKTLKDMESLIHKAQEDKWITSHLQVCWLTAYASTPLYSNTTDQAFIAGLKQFLTMVPRFYNDVVFGDNGAIKASRCHVYSNKIDDSNEQAHLMQRMRDVASDSSLSDFAYNNFFIYFEQFILILPSTLQTVGITIAVMFVVTAFFLPQPIIVLMVMVQVTMIVTCIFGYMAIWNLNLSSITMVHLIMSVGLSVDFCAHVCTAYMVSEKTTRGDRARDAIVHASGPILNGGSSSLVGLLGLLFSESFIFQSFFKVMFLVILFGVMHAVFFTPVLLSFFGPNTYIRSSEDEAGNNTRSNGHAKVVPEISDNDNNLYTISNGKEIPDKEDTQILEENETDLDNIDKDNGKVLQYNNTAFVKGNIDEQEDKNVSAALVTVINVQKTNDEVLQYNNNAFVKDSIDHQENGTSPENVESKEQNDQNMNAELVTVINVHKTNGETIQHKDNIDDQENGQHHTSFEKASHKEDLQENETLPENVKNKEQEDQNINAALVTIINVQKTNGEDHRYKDNNIDDQESGQHQSSMEKASHEDPQENPALVSVINVQKTNGEVLQYDNNSFVKDNEDHQDSGPHQQTSIGKASLGDPQENAALVTVIDIQKTNGGSGSNKTDNHEMTDVTRF